MALMMREEYGNFSIVQREPLIIFIFAVVAQLVEHFHGKEEVAGSIPANSSKNLVNKGNTIIDNISII